MTNRKDMVVYGSWFWAIIFLIQIIALIAVIAHSFTDSLRENIEDPVNSSATTFISDTSNLLPVYNQEGTIIGYVQSPND